MESKPVFTIFGATLKRLRKGRGISQEALALETGFDRTFISRMERGLTQPSLESMLRLSQALDTSLTDLCQEFDLRYSNYARTKEANQL